MNNNNSNNMNRGTHMKQEVNEIASLQKRERREEEANGTQKRMDP